MAENVRIACMFCPALDLSVGVGQNWQQYNVSFSFLNHFKYLIMYQIGNFVKSGLGIYTIAAISMDGVEALQDAKGGLFSASSVIINSIPINHEWLLKFGFEKTYNSNRSTRFDIEIDGHCMITYEFCLHKTQNLVYGGKNIQCDFVHELQNKIYALTNSALNVAECYF